VLGLVSQSDVIRYLADLLAAVDGSAANGGLAALAAAPLTRLGLPRDDAPPLRTASAEAPAIEALPALLDNGGVSAVRFAYAFLFFCLLSQQRVR
jgi:hypothetical protein